MKKAVLILVAVFIAAQPPLIAQTPAVSMQVTLMESWAIYTMADYNRNPNLFIVYITNNENDSTVGYVILEMEISVIGCADPSVADGRLYWGVTNGVRLAPSQTITYRNDDSFYDNIYSDDIRSEFVEAVINTGSALPAGYYQYSFRLCYTETRRNWYENVPVIASDYRDVTITQPTAPELIYPGEQTEEGIVIYETNPTFQWLSTSARSDVYIYYRILICEKREGQSNDEAIDNLPFFEVSWQEAGAAPGPPWKVREIGAVFPLTFPYPSSEEAFTAGRKYVWQVFARSERNMSNSSAGFSDESEIFCLQYGELPENLIPAEGGEMDIAQPAFSWSAALRAQGYEVRVSGELEPADPEVETNFWEETVAFNFLDHVPEGGILIPGRVYYWKVRAADGDWSTPTNFTARYMGVFNLDILCPEITPLEPQFSWTNITGIDRYDLVIYTSPDPSNVFHTIGDLSMVYYSYLPTDPQLEYNRQYQAKVKAYRENHLILETEYSPFLCHEPRGITGAAPELTVTIRQDFPRRPAFTWTPVSGAASYRLYINNSVITSRNIWNTTTSLFNLIYPAEALVLNFGATYFAWVQPLEETGDPMGPHSSVRAFTIPGQQGGGGVVQMEIIIGP